MVGYMPKEVLEGLEAARKRERRKRSRMRIEVGGESFTVLRYWDTGLSLEAEVPHLRGLADLYEGGRHVAQCLIVASAEEAGEMVFEFKRNTATMERPAADFVRDEAAPAGLLPRPS